MVESWGLIADIGGTNARFALVDKAGNPAFPATLRCADHPGLLEAARHYLHDKQDHRPSHGAFAVAGPVGRESVAATNMPWQFSIEETRHALNLATLSVINDFTAVALALPHLQDIDRHRIGGETPAADAPLGVLGAGTGLGVSGLVPTPEGEWIPLTGEGGHTTLAAANEREEKVIAHLRRRFGHVSAERILSGPGLVNLRAALAAIDGRADLPPLSPAAITEQGGSDACPLCRETLNIFFSLLGTTAGNLALTLGAFGGVYIAGGIAPRMIDVMERSDFRRRFEGKGRMESYLKPIPVYVVTHAYPAFLGLSRMVRRMTEK